MIFDYYSDDFVIVCLEDIVSLCSVVCEVCVMFYVVLNWLELNDLDGEEQFYIDDCFGVFVIFEEVL